MAPKDFSTLPFTPKTKVEPFELHISEQKLQDFKTLLKLSPLAIDSYENQEVRNDGMNYGVTSKWVGEAKRAWLEDFDWRKHEAHLNTFPQYTTTVTDSASGHPFTIHFAALFSKKPDAIPLVHFHGWPSSFQEFLPVVSLLREKYTPDDLPYHIIVPSLPGYPLSSAPPLDRDWTVPDTARVMHEFMLALGFSSYVAQGGDIGAAVARVIAVRYAECKALHLNYSFMFPPKDANNDEFSELEKEGLKRMESFNFTGNAYGRMHGTRTSTIGHVLSSSPVALLAWIGEKYLEWVDPSRPLPLHTILEEVCLWWFTGAISTSLYPYREDFLTRVHKEGYFHGQKELYVDKPLGYSYFKWELAPMPRSWVARSGKLEWFKAHESSGHFPALECPEVLWADLESFVAQVWK